MGWETRIFFDIGGKSVVVRQRLSLDDVANQVLPGMTALDDKDDAEQRRDDYVILQHCPQSADIGLKARAVRDGAYYTLLELKTVVRSQENVQTSSNAASALQCWTKSGAYAHGNTADKELWIDFLKARQGQTLADVALDWMDQHMNDSGVPLLQANKKRRRASWRGLDVEETDIEFQMEMSSRLNSSSSSATSFKLRSWAVEGGKTQALVELANTWMERYHGALDAIGINNEDDMPRVWIASYPAMVKIIANELMVLDTVEGEKYPSTRDANLEDSV